MRSRTLCAFCATLGFLASPLPAYSQNPYPLEVTIYPGGYYNLMSYFGNIPGGAAFVPAESFKEGHAVTLKDMLGKTPGVYAQPRYGEEVRLSIRGSGLSRGFHLRGINILQDGIPINLADGSGDFQEIDPLMTRYVEVYRGANALRYGTATLGGAINAVTQTGLNQNESLLRTEAGSYGAFRTHASTGQVFDSTDIYAAITKTNSDGWRQQSEENKTRLNANIGHKFNDNIQTRFYMAWNDLEQEVPGTLSYNDAMNNPKTAPANNIRNDYARDVRSLRLSNSTKFSLSESWDMEIGGYANHKNLYHPIFQVIDQDSVDTGLFSRLTDDKTTVGLNLSSGLVDSKRFINNEGNRGNKTVDANLRSRNVEFYAETRLGIAKGIDIIPGIQAYISDRNYDDNLNPSASDDKTFQSINPKLGFIANIIPSIKFFGNISRSSEPPTFSELVQSPVVGFVPLEDQKAWTAEIGSRGAKGPVSWDITLYRAWVRDELLQFTTGAGIPASTFNADKTIHQGIEAGIDIKAADRVTLGLTYTLNDFYFDSDDQYGDNNLAGAPPHIFVFSGRYNDPSGFYIEPSIEWVPKGGYVDYANTLESNPYAVLNTKAGVNLGSGVNVFLDARNILDRRYLSNYSTVTDARTANTSVFYPGEGQTIYAGFVWKF